MSAIPRIQAPRGTIADFMTPVPCTIQVTATVVDARRRMDELCVRHLPVVDGHRLVGIVTERDLYVLAAIRGVDPAATSIGVVMTPNPLCARTTTPVQDIARDLGDRCISSALVIDEQGRLIGIFTEADAMRALGAPCLTPGHALTQAHNVSTI